MNENTSIAAVPMLHENGNLTITRRYKYSPFALENIKDIEDRSPNYTSFLVKSGGGDINFTKDIIPFNDVEILMYDIPTDKFYFRKVIDLLNINIDKIILGTCTPDQIIYKNIVSIVMVEELRFINSTLPYNPTRRVKERVITDHHYVSNIGNFGNDEEVIRNHVFLPIEAAIISNDISQIEVYMFSSDSQPTIYDSPSFDYNNSYKWNIKINLSIDSPKNIIKLNIILSDGLILLLRLSGDCSLYVDSGLNSYEFEYKIFNRYSYIDFQIIEKDYRLSEKDTDVYIYQSGILPKKYIKKITLEKKKWLYHTRAFNVNSLRSFNDGNNPIASISEIRAYTYEDAKASGLFPNIDNMEVNKIYEI